MPIDIGSLAEHTKGAFSMRRSKLAASLFAGLFLPASLVATSALASPPPRTLAYQGELSSTDGTPLEGEQSIEFSLYDSAEDGAALWVEVDAVGVVGGRFQTELGDATAIPEELFNRQLYLGVAVNGESEMTPRAKLTAAPVAIRALQRLQNEFLVPAEGTPEENGLSLLSAMVAADAAAAAAPEQPFVVRLDAGEYELPYQLVVTRNTSLVGAGRERTFLRSSFEGATVLLQSGTELRDMQVHITPPGDINEAIAANIANNDGSQVHDVRIENTLLVAEAPTSSTGYTSALHLCNAVGAELRNVIARAKGGESSHGLSSNCGPAIQDMRMSDVELHAADATFTIAFAGQAERSHVDGLVARALSTVDRDYAEVVGIRLMPATDSGVFRDLDVSAEATNVGTGNLLGIHGHTGMVEFLGGDVFVSGRGAQVAGVVLWGAPDGAAPVFDGVDVVVRGSAAGGAVAGVNADNIALAFRNGSVRAECLADNTGGCNTMMRGAYSEAPGPLMLVEHSRLELNDAFVPATPMPWNNTVLGGSGWIRVEHSTLRQLTGEGWVMNVGEWEGTPPLAVEVRSSILETAPASALVSGCAFGAPESGGVVVSHSRIAGGVCGPASCAATTTRANVFLADACPSE